MTCRGKKYEEIEKQFSVESGDPSRNCVTSGPCGFPLGAGFPHPPMAPEIKPHSHSGARGPRRCRGPNVRVLDHDVLMGDESVDAIVPAFPPVVGSPLVKQQGCPLLEGQLSGCPAHVVKLGNGLDLFHFWKESKKTEYPYGQQKGGQEALLRWPWLLRGGTEGKPGENKCGPGFRTLGL